MDYLDSASNPGSLPQRLSDRKCQKLHLDQKEAFLVNFSTQTLVLVPTATFAREITEYLRKINVRINDL